MTWAQTRAPQPLAQGELQDCVAEAARGGVVPSKKEHRVAPLPRISTLRSSRNACEGGGQDHGRGLQKQSEGRWTGLRTT